MFVQTASGDIIELDTTGCVNDSEFHSLLWKVQFDITFTKTEDYETFIKKYIENVF